MTFFLIGVALGLVTVAAMALAGVLRERGTWAASVIAIASFYVVFAVQIGEAATVIAHSGLAFGFVLLALVGARAMPWLLVAALIGHGLFDAAVDLLFADPSPAWWAPFCLGVDLTLGLTLAILIQHGALRPAPSARARSAH